MSRWFSKADSSYHLHVHAGGKILQTVLGHLYDDLRRRNKYGIHTVLLSHHCDGLVTMSEASSTTRRRLAVILTQKGKVGILIITLCTSSSIACIRVLI